MTMKKLSIILLFLAANAHAQYCAGYAKEYTVILQPGSITGTLTNYTLLISGAYPYLAGAGSGGFSTSAGGYDITFNQLGTPLIWNMPIYVSGTGQIKANVLIPSAGVGTVISMCVGKTGMTAPTGSAYDSFTKMALQFPAANYLTDSTGLQAPVPMASPSHVSTGPPYLVDALSLPYMSYLDLGSTPGFPYGGNSFTISFWDNLIGTTWVGFIGWGTPTGDHDFNLVSAPDHTTPATTNTTGVLANGILTAGSWHRRDLVFSLGGGAHHYLDGVPNGSGSCCGGGALNILSGPGGSVGRARNNYYLAGQMADVRVVTTNRTDTWIAAEYLNQSNPSVFYAIAPIVSQVMPIISAVTITANSPLSVKGTWTTDVPSNSQILCGAVSGGPYTYASSIVNPNVNNWNVTTHSMASNPMPNGAYYCVVSSASSELWATHSAESALIVLPAMPVSVPIAMVNPSVQVMSQLGDREHGIHGAPQTGAWNFSDNSYFTWAEDNNEYLFTTGWGLPGHDLPKWNGTWEALRMEYVKIFDADHTTGARVATQWQNGVNNTSYNTVHNAWFGVPNISVNGSIYDGMYNFFGDSTGGPYTLGALMKTTDHYQSTLAPQHNVGPDTTYITGMTCDSTPVAGTVHATSKLNIVDEVNTIVKASVPLGQPYQAHVAMYVAGAFGTGVNGVFGNSVSATPTIVSWTNPGGTCAGWSWSPTGGTGSGGGTINVYGWDVPSVSSLDGMYGTWIQNDGPGYENGTKWAGMDGFVYWFYQGYQGLGRMRVEDLPLQGTLPGASRVGHYTGNQLGDDGIYESSWDYTGAKPWTVMNRAHFATADNGKGGSFPQSQYLTDLHRFVIVEEVSATVDSTAGGVAIYDGGLYPWSPLTLIGSGRRNVDTYWEPAGGPEFPQFVAKSQKAANGVTSINLAYSGQNFGGYDLFMTPGVQFVAKGAAVAKPLLAPGEVGSGMDLAYNFDVPTGSLSMPNAAPADASQKWAWKAKDAVTAMYTDPYGSIVNSLPSTSSSGGFYPTTAIQGFGLPTPYAEALPGPLTVLDCFGHYPSALLWAPGANAVALQKGSDLRITAQDGARATAVMGTGSAAGTIVSITVDAGGTNYTFAPLILFVGGGAYNGKAHAVMSGNAVTSIVIDNPGSGFTSAPTIVITGGRANGDNWNVSFLGVPVGVVTIPDNSIGCVVVRRDSANRVSVYNSAGIGKSLPLTASATAVIPGPWTSSVLTVGDGPDDWGHALGLTNSFWGIESLLRVWNRDLADDELIAEMAAVRGVLWSRGKGSSIP